jgi:hypothetical protein
MPGGKMKRNLLVLLMLVSASGWARDKDGGMWVQGDTSCGQYIEARAARATPKYDEALVIGIMTPAWLAGFLTAYNMLTPDTYNILGSSDMQSALVWLDNFCKANPLERISTGAATLVNELYPKRHRARKDAGR